VAGERVGPCIHRVLALRDGKVVRFQWFDDCDEALRDAGLEEDR
jgi:hypothetical protein